ncbi:hypothetical protein [Actinocrispum sp. NPDC049592]|uniref:hypothetical protein n=1 Tax=Actinocrispum sp. NPDC049592 TaxID=3154835 RepID=UPI003422F520
MSAAGPLLAVGTGDGTTQLWRLDGTPASILKGLSQTVKSVAFTPNGTTLAAGEPPPNTSSTPGISPIRTRGAVTSESSP